MLLAGVSAAATVGVSSTTEHTIMDPDNIPGDYRLSTIQNTCVNDSEITNDTPKDIIEYNGEITHL